MNTRIVIEDGQFVSVASAPGWTRRRLRNALTEGGFEIEEKSSWIYSGLDLIRPWP